MYVCVCKGFGMTTHMVQQITWANNRVPLLCQHRSYSTTKCLWSSWYHLEMGGTTLLADKVGDNMTLTEFGRLLLACQNEKWHFYTLVEKHLTSRFAASWLFHQFIHRFSSRVLRAIKHSLETLANKGVPSSSFWRFSLYSIGRRGVKHHCCRSKSLEYTLCVRKLQVLQDLHITMFENPTKCLIWIFLSKMEKIACF